MGTPVLSKKQQQNTLSAKKNKPKEVLKNVLASPYDTNYWPEILDLEDKELLTSTLAQKLPWIKPDKPIIHWNQIKHIPKEQRKEYLRKLHPTKLNEQRHLIRIGFNEVAKLLEKNEAGVVLISADIKPRLMVQHILDLSVLYKVPVLVVEELKQILKKQCRIGGSVFAIIKTIPFDSKLNVLKELIEKIFARCPAPVNHINYNKSLECPQVNNNNEILIENDTEIKNENVYLKKPSIGRAFLPVDTRKSTNEYFIPFTETDESNVSLNTNEIEYKSLVVKRLRSDSSRNKKKVEKSKKKRKSRNK